VKSVGKSNLPPKSSITLLTLSRDYLCAFSMFESNSTVEENVFRITNVAINAFIPIRSSIFVSSLIFQIPRENEFFMRLITAMNEIRHIM
jgi:hypothetical protein